MDLQELACCAVKEIDGLSDHGTPQVAMEDFCDFWCKAPFIIFTAVMGRKSAYGARFAAFIRKEKLGKVTPSTARVNPNSNNKVRVWIWEPDYKALQKWRTRWEAKLKVDDDRDENYLKLDWRYR